MSLSVLEKEEITESVRLTKRELQIIRSISLGYTSKEVAAQISKSKRVVDFHLTNIYD
ncbi:LuxR C-terminal-related transcriptional regulator, partial [Vibrio parahaemolyticus]